MSRDHSTPRGPAEAAAVHAVRSARVEPWRACDASDALVVTTPSEGARRRALARFASHPDGAVGRSVPRAMVALSGSLPPTAPSLASDAGRAWPAGLPCDECVRLGGGCADYDGFRAGPVIEAVDHTITVLQRVAFLHATHNLSGPADLPAQLDDMIQQLRRVAMALHLGVAAASPVGPQANGWCDAGAAPQLLQAAWALLLEHDLPDADAVAASAAAVRRSAQRLRAEAIG